jgi:hypothetical protein
VPDRFQFPADPHCLAVYRTLFHFRLFLDPIRTGPWGFLVHFRKNTHLKKGGFVRSMAGLVVVYVAVAFTAVSCREADGGGYLKGHELIAPLEVVELQGGVVGFTGDYCTIEQDGQWSAGPVLPGKEEKGAPTAKGKLTSEQLAQLARQLHQYSLSTLSSHGAPAVNPRIVKIRLGQETKVLNPNPGDTIEEDDLAIRGRYEGILKAVKSMCVTEASSP